MADFKKTIAAAKAKVADAETEAILQGMSDRYDADTATLEA